MMEETKTGLNDTFTHGQQIVEFYQKPFQRSHRPEEPCDFPPEIKQLCCSKKKQQVENLRTKLVVIGDQAVGKTSLVQQFCRNKFQEAYTSTVGVDFEVVFFEILNIAHQMLIWDTAGEEKFKVLHPSYYREAKIIFAVFDLSKTQTLINTETWILEAKRHAEPGCIVFIVGNKQDIVSQSQLNFMQEEATNLAKRVDAEYWTVSSCTSQGVTKLFKRAACLAFTKAIVEKITKDPSLLVEESAKKKKEDGCVTATTGIVRKCFTMLCCSRRVHVSPEPKTIECHYISGSKI